MVQFTIKGAVAPVFTPVKEDGSVNYSIIGEYMKYLHDEGIRAILVGGTSGEAMSLNVDERKKLSEAWLQAAKLHAVQVIVQVGGAPLPDVIELAHHAETIQVDAILTLPELYFKPRTAEALVSYLQKVSAAAPHLPLLYYHFPMMSGVHIDVKKFFRLASSEIPNFKGMKADLEVAMQVSEYMSEDQQIFIGNHHLTPAAYLGYTSSIATVTNLFPNMVQGMYASVKLNEMEKSRELQTRMNRLVDGISSHGDWVPTMKVGMELVTGVKVGPPLQPLSALNKDQRTLISEQLHRLNINMH